MCRKGLGIVVFGCRAYMHLGREKKFESEMKLVGQGEGNWTDVWQVVGWQAVRDEPEHGKEDRKRRRTRALTSGTPVGGPCTPFPHPDSTKGLAVASGRGSWAELGCLARRAKKKRRTRKERERAREIPFSTLFLMSVSYFNLTSRQLLFLTSTWPGDFALKSWRLSWLWVHCSSLIRPITRSISEVFRTINKCFT